jgi:hypothetical protein
MTILNIIDRRKKPYRFKRVNAIIEPTRHDNSVKDGDRAGRNPKQDKAWIGYDEKEHVDVAYAIQWASKHKDSVTLYLYDKDRGIYPVTKRTMKHVAKWADEGRI